METDPFSGRGGLHRLRQAASGETISNVNLRQVDAALWRRLRIESVRRDVPMGELVSQAVAAWLAQHEGEA